LVVHKPLPRAKTVPQRITAVNSVRNVSIVLTNTQALPITVSNVTK
jgi:hypothetical protein